MSWTDTFFGQEVFLKKNKFFLCVDGRKFSVDKKSEFPSRGRVGKVANRSQ